MNIGEIALNTVVDIAEREKIISPEDYYDDEGYLCCGICHERKEFDFAWPAFTHRGTTREPRMCNCQKKKAREEEAEIERREAVKQIEELKNWCFADSELKSWTFQSDNGKQPKMEIGRKYVKSWEKVKEESIGLLLFGNVGTGKSYCACAIANALCEKGVHVRYVNLAEVLNELQNSEDRNGYINHLASYALLIIDDFGVQRQTEYATEQIFNLIDKRNRKRLPLIVTTNLTMEEMKHPADIAQKRIYDRVLQMCTPVIFAGPSLRTGDSDRKRKILAEILGEE